MHNAAPMPDTTTVPLIGAVEAARRLGVSRATVQRRARSGALPPAHVSYDSAGIPCGYLFAEATVTAARVAAYRASIPAGTYLVHIINNLDIPQVECGADYLMHDPEKVDGQWSDALVPTAGGALAAWDHVVLPDGHRTCPECYRAYQS